MKTIYKYQIQIRDEFKLKLPIETQILSFQVQNGRPVLWVMLDPELEREERNFRIFRTGHPIQIAEEKSLHFIGTIQDENLSLVWHLFEER